MSGTCSIDLDALDDCHVALEAVGVDLSQLIADGVQVSSGKKNRGKLLYRAPAGYPVKDTLLIGLLRTGKDKFYCIIEFRAGNVHDSIWPSIHPETGKPYEWIGDWRNLPELPECLQKIWHEWALAKEGDAGRLPMGAKNKSAPFHALQH